MDDADGHLIYHPGDILQARCTHHFVMFSLAYYISMFCMRKNLLKYSWEKICPNLCVFSELYLYFFVFLFTCGIVPSYLVFLSIPSKLNWKKVKPQGNTCILVRRKNGLPDSVYKLIVFFIKKLLFNIQHSIAHILQQTTIEKDYNEIPHVQMLGIEYSSDLMPYIWL